MKIAILGTGPVARTLGEGLAGVGHDVVLGSRTPDTVGDAPLQVTDHAAAIAPAEVVVNAITGSEALAALTAIGPEVFAGKVLWDLANAVSPSFQLIHPDASHAEALQQALPDAHVVKALNTVAAPLMVHPELIPASTAFLSGEDPGAKDAIRSLLTDLGWAEDAVVDLGGIVSARGPEHYFLLFAAIWQATGTPLFNVRLVS